MRVRVLFFGRLREIVGASEDWAEVGEGSRVEQVFSQYEQKFPQLSHFRPSVVPSVNEDFSGWQAGLHEGDEVAFLPPVSGGSSGANATVAPDRFELTRTAIRADEILANVKAPADGAVVVFDGIVRNQSKGKSTLYLDYEAYEPMALKKMREIGEQIRKRFDVDRIAMVHRLGRLEIGETSVLIAVSAPHRRAAFDAARFAIESLKRTVPIWKKEYFADGAVWVEGEIAGSAVPEGEQAPFPAKTESDS